ncbi:MAG TPA: hypothetical protein VK427_20725 [Kofleriaceae bacterium]|nr:hypothetical protein [Kofleriaceae bacterium]
MWDELSVERAVADDELARAVARAMTVDPERVIVVTSMAHAPDHGIVVEKRSHPGDFALRVGLFRVPDRIDRVEFYRGLADALACKLLVDDGEVDPYTAMLVTPDGDAVRVKLDPGALDREDEALVIAGLCEHVESDDMPDALRLASSHYHQTRGQVLARALQVHREDPTRTTDAFMAAYTPEVQDAEHMVAQLLATLVHRPATHADERALLRTCAVLRRAFPVPASAGATISHLLGCAEDVLAGPWDPDAPG